MIIIEGADLVGKTTLCQKLLKSPGVQEYGAIYSHFSRLPDRFERGRGYRDRMSVALVQDRFHMSEVVYSQMRSKLTDTTMTPARYAMIDAWHTLHAGITVVVAAMIDKLIEDRWDRPEMYSLGQTLECNQIFKHIAQHQEWRQFKRMHVDYVVYTTPNKPWADADDIQAIITLWQERLVALHNLKGPRYVPEPMC